MFAQLPDVGKEVAAGDDCAALESVKAASEVYTPVSGVVSTDFFLFLSSFFSTEDIDLLKFFTFS